MQCPTNSSAKPSTILTNTVVSSWTSDTTYAGYSYRGDITHSGITSDTSATVVFGNAEASSGNYAPFAVTSTGKISVYSKVNTSITIPTIRIDATLNYFNLKGTVGSDTKPIKIVNGECVAVTNDLIPSVSYPVTVTSPLGETIFHSQCVKVGRTVFVGIIFNLSVARTNTSVLKMVSTSSLTPIMMSNIPVFNYTQNGDNSTNIHRFVNVYHNSSDNANTVYINVGSDMTLPIGNWQLTFTYLTDA